MSFNINQNITELQRISKKGDARSLSTIRKREQVIKETFNYLGIDEYKYFKDNKTKEQRNQAIERASKTLSKKLAAHEKAIQRDIKRQQRYKETLTRELMKKSKENLHHGRMRIDNAELGTYEGVTNRTQNFLHRKGLLPERSDLNNMSIDQLEQAKQTMEMSIQMRSLIAIQEYAREYLKERYFKGIADDPGVSERIDKMIYKLKGDYTQLLNLEEKTQEPAFKGGYDDTDKMLKNNANTDISEIMYDRLDRLEEYYNIA